MVHAVFCHLQYRHRYFFINISRHFNFFAFYGNTKRFFQCTSHHCCNTVHLYQQSRKVCIRNTLFAFSGICNLITGGLWLIFTIHMCQKVFNPPYHCPTKIRHFFVSFHTSQFSFQISRNHTQQLQNAF